MKGLVGRPTARVLEIGKTPDGKPRAVLSCGCIINRRLERGQLINCPTRRCTSFAGGLRPASRGDRA